MLDPTSGAGALAKVGDALKGWPLWLLAAIAACLSLLLFPAFSGLIPQPYSSAVLFVVVSAWILTVAKALSYLPTLVRARTNKITAERKFVITPEKVQCHWGISKQGDGSYTTQIAGHLTIKNLTNDKLHLVSVRLIKPKIRGEVLHSWVLIRSLSDNVYGTSNTSGFYIPPNGFLPASMSIIYRGMPNQRTGYLPVTFEISDATGNRSRARVSMRCVTPGPEKEALHKRITWIWRMG